MPIQNILLIVIVFFAVFTQSLTGFGSGLIAMALLPELLGIQVAAPLVALLCGTLELVLLVRYRSAIKFKSVWRLIIASIVGVPLGIYAVARLDENIILAGLGIVLAGYALYALLNLKLPELKQNAWAYFAGFVGGILGGAYNTNGPPVIIYGSCRKWEPAEFKGNLQGFFIINSIMIIVSHAVSRHFTTQVWQDYLLILPVLALGVLVGVRMDRYLNPLVFRKIVLVLLFVMGLRLIF